MTDNKAEITTEWSIEDIKAVEVQIGADLANAGHLLILGVTAGFYRQTEDKDGAAWMRRVMAGSGFTFSRAKRTDGELSARDQAIVALLRDGATLTTIADTLGIGVATAHRVMVATDEKPNGGSKDGAGKVATVKPAATVTEPTGEAGTDTESDESTTTTTTRTTRTVNPVSDAIKSINRLKDETDTERAADGWATILAHLLEVSGYDVATLMARAEKLAAIGAAAE